MPKYWRMATSGDSRVRQSIAGLVKRAEPGGVAHIPRIELTAANAIGVGRVSGLAKRRARGRHAEAREKLSRTNPVRRHRLLATLPTPHVPTRLYKIFSKTPQLF